MADMPPMGLGGSLSDLISTIKGGVQNLSALNSTLQSIFPRINGTFTLSAATTTVVPQPSISATSMVSFSATNATGALIVRTNGLYHSASTSGVSFSMSTQSGSAIAGGTFEYFVVNPL